MRFSALCLFSVATFLAGQSVTPARAENWPHWRGPAWNGSSTETNLPDRWSRTENVAWTTPLPGRSGATPVIWEDSVFLPSPDADRQLAAVVHGRQDGQNPLAADGRPRQRREGQERHGLAFGRYRRQAGRGDVRHRRPGGLRFRGQATLVAKSGQTVRQARPEVALWFQPFAVPRQALHRSLAAGRPQSTAAIDDKPRGIRSCCVSIRRRAANYGGRSARPTPGPNRRTPTLRRSFAHRARRGDPGLSGPIT